MTIFPKRTVYLAGPIAGKTHDEARYGWRREFARLLPTHIFAYSPMRAQDHLKHHGVLETDPGTRPDNPFSTAAGIVTRDHNDVKYCDAVVACFLDSGDVPSLGTAYEFGLADAYNTPVIMVAKKGEVHRKHAILQRVAGYTVETLEEAAQIVASLLTPGT